MCVCVCVCSVVSSPWWSMDCSLPGSVSMKFFRWHSCLVVVDHKKLWKILTEMGIPDHPTCLLRNLYQVKKQQLESDMKRTGPKLGNEYIKAVYCHPAYLTSMQSEGEVSQSCPTLCNPVDCRLLHLWDFPGKNTGVGYHFLLQGIFPTQGSNLGLPHRRQTL